MKLTSHMNARRCWMLDSEDAIIGFFLFVLLWKIGKSIIFENGFIIKKDIS